MTKSIRQLAILGGVFLTVALVWNVVVWRKKVQLIELAEPLHAACQTAAGCPVAPSGWKPNGIGGYYRDFHHYTATRERFVLKQHVATDVWLVVEGGKDVPLRARREMD